MASIGTDRRAHTGSEVLSRAQARAALVPDCLVEARRLANTVIAGWHGRRKRGIGENFWQFRPYVDGESLSRIDWRRSARDDHTYVRDREWEAAHTIWLWADLSPSMMYKSHARQRLEGKPRAGRSCWRWPRSWPAPASASAAPASWSRSPPAMPPNGWRPPSPIAPLTDGLPRTDDDPRLERYRPDRRLPRSAG